MVVAMRSVAPDVPASIRVAGYVLGVMVRVLHDLLAWIDDGPADIAQASGASTVDGGRREREDGS